jgi:hypothetical protein
VARLVAELGPDYGVVLWLHDLTADCGSVSV